MTMALITMVTMGMVVLQAELDPLSFQLAGRSAANV
jgi:hypothetical protein